jgi:hypothetical protein
MKKKVINEIPTLLAHATPIHHNVGLLPKNQTKVYYPM